MTINPSSLQIALEEEERWRRRLTVTVPGSEVEAERSRVAQRLVKRLKLPGFRKGKVPAAVLEKRVAFIDREVAESLQAQFDALEGS